MGNSLTGNNRKTYIDYLKFIGIIGITIVHVESPSLIMMIRSFDVPLLVFISGFLGEKSYSKNSSQGPLKYYIKRINRLLAPTWIFLTFYFVLKAILGHVYDIKYYIASYCLTRDGIGYVWIILVYLMCAMILPLLHKVKFCRNSIIVIACVYILYEVAYHFNVLPDNLFFKYIVYQIIPYGIITWLGMTYDSQGSHAKKTIAIGALILFILYVIFFYYKFEYFQQVSIQKYPPRAYYLSYALFCIYALFLVFRHKLKLKPIWIISFISTHSLWIYLWHILALDVASYFLPFAWYIQYPFVMALSIAIVWIQNRFIDLLFSKFNIKFLTIFRG